MTKDEIIQMAEECGAIHYWHLSRLERFAALVADAEREACARVCESQPMRQDIDVREQCAAAIRARGNT